MFILFVLFSQVDFNAIGKILKNDQLEESYRLNKEKKEEISKQKEEVERKRYQIPNSDIFWGILSEYFLVKNRDTLGWDKSFTDYGLDTSFKEFLKENKLDYKFKILITSSNQPIHFGLPGYGKEIILMISESFIKELSLDKNDINLIFLEDLFRVELNLFKKKITTPELNKLIGSNTYPKKMDLTEVKKVIANFSKEVLEKGFTFQEQFDLTKRLKEHFKKYPKIEEDYIKLLNRINQLIPLSLTLRDYNKFYPSPEFQLEWLEK